MDPDLLLQMLSDPALAEQLSSMGVYGDRQALLGQATKRADALRSVPSAQGREVGRTYVASSPLEHAAVAMQRLRGENDLADARGQQRGLITADQGARQGLSAAMAKAMRARSVGTQPPVTTAPQGGFDGTGIGLDPSVT